MTPIFDEIRVDDLVSWARTGESERWMPSLIRQLVGASGAKIVETRFLTHEQTNLGGWDAIVRTENAGSFVPEGVSGWEFSKRKTDIWGKIREDITKRTSDPEGLAPGDTSLVTVTLQFCPRRKQGDGYQEAAEHKAALEAELSAETGWKEVKILDAANLADWIALTPSVGLWLAEVMGRQAHGARSMLSLWQQIATIRTGLTPETFHSGRHAFVGALNSWFEDESRPPFEARSWSPEDTRDAIAAWWFLRAANGTTQNISAIAVSSDAAWNYLSKTTKPLLLFIDCDCEPASEQVTAAIANGHRVIIPTAAAHGRGFGCKLEPLYREILAEELRKSGIDNTETWRISGDAGGSGVVLKRILSRNPAKPEWAGAAVEIAPIVLFGAWDASSEGDRERIADVFGCPYDEVEKKLLPFLTSNDPLLRRHEKCWRVVYREEAWRWLCGHMSAEHYARFKTAATSVLCELNPRYELPEEERIYAGIRGAVPRHSHRLRRAVGESLCLLSLRSPEGPDGNRARDLARQIAGAVFKNSADWKLWASLDFALVFIAEAVPDLFLKAIEADLKRDVPATVALFHSKVSAFFSDRPHVEVMWALEALMWEREWVQRTAIVLARLAAKDPGANSHPRPLGVLREAFLPWYPQCALNVDERCSVLDAIAAVEPDIAWKLFFALLPKTHDSSSPQNRPRYRNGALPPSNGVSNSERWKLEDHVTKRLAEAVGTDLKRWKDLLGELSNLPQGIFDTVLKQVSEVGSKLDEEPQAELWEVLRKEAARHRFFVSAQWRMADAVIAKIESLAAAFEPRNPVLRWTWLFVVVEAFPPGTDSKTPYAERARLLELKQLEALREMVAFGGLQAVKSLALRVGQTHTHRIGYLIARESICDMEQAIFPSWFEDEFEAMKAFARGYAGVQFHALGWDWLRRIGAPQWPPNTFGELANMFSIERATFTALEEFGQPFIDAFWQNVGTWINQASPDDAEHAIREWMRCGRALSALDGAAARQEDQLPLGSGLLLELLESVRNALSSRADDGAQQLRERLDHYHLITVLGRVQRDGNLADEQLERLEGIEWSFLTVFQHNGSPRTLLARLRREPSFFVELIEFGGYRTDQPEEEGGREWSEQQKIVAQACSRLLDCVGVLPGSAADGSLNEQELRTWVAEVRRLAREKRFVRVCESKLGGWLFQSPVDAAGFWPCAPVCRLMSDDGSDEISGAFKIAIFNNQGWPGPGNEGMEMTTRGERAEGVAKLVAYSQVLELSFPSVALLLRESAEEQRRMMESQRLRDDE